MKRWKQLIGLATVLLLTSLPFAIQEPYFLRVIILFGIYAIYALALDFLIGFLGEVSFGHAAFLGIGAYATGILVERYQFSYWAAAPVALGLAGATGFVVGFATLRLRGVHFAILTLASSEILRLVALNWQEFTHGSMGLSVADPSVPLLGQGRSFTPATYYYFVFFILVLVFRLLARLVASPVGNSMVAIRENHSLAAAVGIPIFKVKLMAFVISGVIAAMAGVAYAPFVGIIGPDLLGSGYSALGLLMVIVGGKGTLYGALVGAFVFSIITEMFRFANELRMMAFAVFLLASLVLNPGGIVSLLFRAWERLTRARTGVVAEAQEK